MRSALPFVVGFLVCQLFSTAISRPVTGQSPPTSARVDSPGTQLGPSTNGVSNQTKTSERASEEKQVPLPVAEPASIFASTIRPQLTRLCVDCHAPEDDEDAVRFLRDTTAEAVAGNRGIWSSVAEQLRNRTMPPGDAPQPTERERLEITQWVDSYLDSTSCLQGEYAGRPVPRRLNREQYTHAIKDLTGVQFDFVETFPADGGGGEGFNNNGETLFLPPLLMERYLEVAQQVLDHIIVTPPYQAEFHLHAGESDSQFELVASDKTGSSMKVVPVGGTASAVLTVHTEADYRFDLRAVHESTEAAPVSLSIDGIATKRILVPAGNESVSRWTTIHFTRGLHQIDLRVPADGAPLAIRSIGLNEQIGDRSERRTRQKATNRLFTPGRGLFGEQDRDAAAQIIRSFARLAWRGDFAESDSARLMKLYDRGTARGESLSEAIKLPLKAVLVSPRFLFIAERGHKSEGVHAVSDVELASRLALFLWDSIPDDELLRVAERNGLGNEETVVRQVDRMLADPRSYRFAEAFSGQWLGTVAVGRTVIPDTEFFRPAYTSELVTDLRRQVSETMHMMLREDRPITDWLDCDYVVVNRRLAKHYGIEPVPLSDKDFETISLGDSTRTGVLGLGAVHMLTSYSRRTSPVLRGGWVLETIFGAHLPAPPPDAGQLEGGEKEMDGKTVRQRLEKHREDPRCAACHDLIDPIGFALENFDVLGRWRDREGEAKIDAVGRLPSGESFTGPMQLRRVLIERRGEFAQQICRRMLGYALGRSLEDADGCTVDKLRKRLEQSEYRINALVLGIVQSVPFQFRQGTAKSASEERDDR